MTNFSQNIVSCMGRGISQSHDNKIQDTASFMINST